jgi:hypothetical protein
MTGRDRQSRPVAPSHANLWSPQLFWRDSSSCAKLARGQKYGPTGPHWAQLQNPKDPREERPSDD